MADSTAVDKPGENLTPEVEALARAMAHVYARSIDNFDQANFDQAMEYPALHWRRHLREAERLMAELPDHGLYLGLPQPDWQETLPNDGVYEYTVSADCDGSNVRHHRRTPRRFVTVGVGHSAWEYATAEAAEAATYPVSAHDSEETTHG